MPVRDWNDVKPGVFFYPKKTLLLGNGFNLALLREEGLSYRRLKDGLNSQDFHIQESIKTELENENNNFETLIRKLEEASRIAGVYGANSVEMDNDAIALREGLAETISNLHPLQERIVANGASRNCSRFLRKFSNIFTLNYDLLLYWVILNESMEGKFKDGFGRSNPEGPLVWLNRDSQNIFYVHGALHLYKQLYENFDSDFLLGQSHFIYKLVRENGSLLEQVSDNINSGRYPFTVVEGNQTQKLQTIIENVYLRDCMDKLKKLVGEVYTFGWSASIPEDTHIIHALGASKITKCFFGVRAGVNLVPIEEQFEIINARRRRESRDGLELIFYNSDTAPVWRADG